MHFNVLSQTNYISICIITFQGWENFHGPVVPNPGYEWPTQGDPGTDLVAGQPGYTGSAD